MDHSRLIKECFWDYNFSSKDIEEILNSDNIKDKQFLFEKILLSSREMLKDLSLFNRIELCELLKKYKVSTFNREYISRRKNIAEFYFFNDPLNIDELKWLS